MESIDALIKEAVSMRLDPSEDINEDTLKEIIEQEIMRFSRENIISVEERIRIKKDIFNSMCRYGILQELLEDDTITEIMINGYKDIFYERNGRLEKWDKCFESLSELEDVAQQIAAKSNRMVNETSPILDTRLYDGSRVNIVLSPISLQGPTITIRKFYDTPITIEKLIEIGSITSEAADLLRKMVRAKYNIFISGGTGSGKTTFLNALSNFIPEDERIITIEDAAELQIHDVNGVRRNLVRLETRSANLEKENEISMQDLIKSALRMRPDRIIVGEIRGAEAHSMLQAMNTGMDGSLSTGHSNSSKDMLVRIETMVLMGMDIPVSAIRRQISSALDIIIHLGRLRDKTRKVMQITEIVGFENDEIILNPLYIFKESGEKNGKVIGKLEKVGSMVNVEKFKAAGIV